jgi:hypothetical protein
VLLVVEALEAVADAQDVALRHTIVCQLVDKALQGSRDRTEGAQEGRRSGGRQGAVLPLRLLLSRWAMPISFWRLCPRVTPQKEKDILVQSSDHMGCAAACLACLLQPRKPVTWAGGVPLSSRPDVLTDCSCCLFCPVALTATTSLSPGHSPPQVTMAAVVLRGS